MPYNFQKHRKSTQALLMKINLDESKVLPTILSHKQHKYKQKQHNTPNLILMLCFKYEQTLLNRNFKTY